MTTVKILVDYISCTLEVLLAAFFFSAFGKSRVSKGRMSAIFAIISIAFMSTITLAGNGSVPAIVSLGLTLLIALCYDFKLHNALLMAVSISLVAMVSEIILGLLFLLVSIKVENTPYSIYSYIIGIVASKFITVLIVLLVRKGNHKMLQSARGSHFFGILLMPIASIISSLLFYQMLSYNITDKLKLIIVVALILLVVANIVIFYVVDRQYELVSARQRLRASDALLDSQRQYYDDVFASQQEARKIRHNLTGIFYTVLARMDAGDIEGAREAVAYQLNDTSKNIALSDKKNGNVIDSIIYAKQDEAKHNNIELRANVRIDTEIKVDDLDIAILLANLLDNAIEATKMVKDNASKVITLAVDVKESNLMIKATNAVLEDVNVKRLESKKKDKKNHGYGVLTISTIAKKYKGACKMNCINSVFESVIFMQNEKYEEPKK